MSDPISRLNAALEGRYRVDREVGEGGMATVYLAADLRHDRKVALKVLRPELAAVVGTDRFLSEIKTTANLQHPHILPLFDSGEADGFLFYVMPYVEGESLRARLDRERELPVEEASKLGSEILDAVAYAHRQGVIHRDIKPENVLLQDGRVLLADFGIALALTAAGGTRLTGTGLTLGTPTYMSPEQATGDRTVDRRTDIYAVGCLIYEMLAGQPPYSGSTAGAILARVLTTDPESLAHHRSAIPQHIATAVHRAISRLPADRFASSEDFLAALSGRATDTGWRQDAKPATRARVVDRVLVLGLAGFGLLASVLALWGWLGRSPNTGVRRLTVPPPRGLSFVPDGYIPALSPDGRTVVFAARDSSTTMLYRRPVDGFDPEPIQGTEGAEYPFFSPDGQWVGFFTETPKEIRKALLAGGSAIRLARVTAARNDAVWRRDGTIVFSWERQGLWAVPEDGGQVVQLTSPDTASGEFDHVRPQDLPDGRLMFAVAMGGAYRGGRTSVMRSAILDRAGSAWELLPGEAGGVYHPAGLMLRESGTWTAERFDLSTAAFRPPRVPILDGTLDAERQHPSPLSFSAAGDVAYFAGVDDVGWTITLVDMTGTSRVLYPELGSYRWPRVSPTGDRLLVGEGSNLWSLWTLDLRTGAFRPFPTQAGGPGEAAWSADGRQIAFTVEDDPEQPFASIYAGNADGTGGERLLVAVQFDAWTSSWSPDGRHLAFYGGPEHNDIWVKQLSEGGPLHRVTSGTSSERHPAFSPDGRWIAYQSDRSGRNEVYVRGFPDYALEHSVSVEGGTEPVWAGDGRGLFFRNGSQFMVVDVHLGDTFSSGTPRTLVSTYLEDDPNGDRSYDVMPDGRGFVIIRSDPRTQPELRIVKGWVDELMGRLRGGS